jgi:hypothetical protein
MERIEKVVLCVSLLALWANLMIVCSAQPQPPGCGTVHRGMMGFELDEGLMMQRGAAPPGGIPAEMIVGARGFALMGNESHLLRLNVVRLIPLEPGRIRDIMASNRSLEEIREAIRAEEGQAVYRGSMKLGNIIYPLTNIDVRLTGEDSLTAEADVIDPKSQTAIVGHMVITVSPSKGGRIGEGQLSISSAEHKGSYQLLLEMNGHGGPFEEMRS